MGIDCRNCTGNEDESPLVGSTRGPFEGVARLQERLSGI